MDNMPTAFDHAKSAAHYARHTVQKLSPKSRLNFSHYSIFDGKIEDIPVSFHNKFDLVVSFCAFEHFTHPEIILDVVKKCLKKDGSFSVTSGLFSPAPAVITVGLTRHLISIIIRIFQSFATS